MFYIAEVTFGRIKIAEYLQFETEDEARECIDAEYDVSTYIVLESKGFN